MVSYSASVHYEVGDLFKELESIEMGQSLVKNYIHLVFSTKHRQPLIDSSVEAELHDYLGGICNELGCRSIIVGGYTDHIHMLFLLSKKMTLIKVVEEVKGHSSKWIKSKGEGYQGFYWQNGYGAFSVSERSVDAVRNYILRQHEHHSTTSFQDEYRTILMEHDMEFDENYLWE